MVILGRFGSLNDRLQLNKKLKKKIVKKQGMSNVLFIQVNSWITRRRRAVPTSHGKGGDCVGLQVSCSPVSAPFATSNPTGVAWKGYLWTNMELLFFENKIRFSCGKI